jgi:thiol-disulfide isomerase/thioredoxin
LKPFAIIKLALIGAVIGALAGLGWQQWQAHRQTGGVDSFEAVKRLPDFSFPDTEGRTRGSDEWLGKIRVVNFWATWCPPCREETPLFVDLQERYLDRGIQFIGIAIDDLEPTQDFIDTYGVNYPVLIGDGTAIELSRRLGNRFQGLPYTVVARADGRIVSRFSGGVERTDLEPLLEQLSDP